MRFTFLLAISGCLVLVAACRNVEIVPNDGSGGSGSSSSTSKSSTNVATTGSSLGSVCTTQVPCGPSEFCDYPDNKCGQGADGVCMLRPEDCGKNLDSTCGCDGTIHTNACETNAVGFDTDDEGCDPSSTPAGMIPCGGHFCTADTYYCEAAFSDIGGEPASYACKPLPPGCDLPTSTCACFPPDTPCASFCAVVPGGGVAGFQLDCPGG